MRYITPLILMAFILLHTIPECLAMTKLQPHAFPEDTATPQISLVARITESTPLEIRIWEHENNVEIRFYDKTSALAGLVRPRSGKFIFAQAHLRDKIHEELIGIEITGPLHELTDIFIIGLDSDNEIAPLHILKKYRYHNFLTENWELDGKKVTIPCQLSSIGKITLVWDQKHQYFLATNE